jgi:hypothetical protein
LSVREAINNWFWNGCGMIDEVVKRKGANVKRIIHGIEKR